MRDVELRREIRRREAEGESPFQPGDFVEVEAEHAYYEPGGGPRVPQPGCVEAWETAGNNDVRVRYVDNGGVERFCFHPNKWELVRAPSWRPS